MYEPETGRPRRLLLKTPLGYVIEEPKSEVPQGPLGLLLPLVLPLFPRICMLLMFLSRLRPFRQGGRVAVTEIERTPTGYRIMEYER